MTQCKCMSSERPPPTHFVPTEPIEFVSMELSRMMGWIVIPQKAGTLSIVGLVGPQLPAQSLAYSGRGRLKKNTAWRGFLSVSGLELCDWPVGRSTTTFSQLPSSPGPAPKWALEQVSHEGSCDHEQEAWTGRTGRGPGVWVCVCVYTQLSMCACVHMWSRVPMCVCVCVFPGTWVSVPSRRVLFKSQPGQRDPCGREYSPSP